jgi:phage terminase small subunit
MPSKSSTRPRLKKKSTLSESHDKGEDGLNYRQKRFVAEYASSLNATESAVKAGYSQKSARQLGAQLLTNMSIQKAVARTQARRLTRADITAERVLAELASVGFSDTDPVLPKPSDKIAALNTLAKHLGLLVERHEVDQRTTLLNVNVSAADLESARLLVETTLKRDRPQIEGAVEPDEDEKS